MKKLTSILLVFVLTVGLVACGRASDNKSAADKSSGTDNNKVTRTQMSTISQTVPEEKVKGSFDKETSRSLAEGINKLRSEYGYEVIPYNLAEAEMRRRAQSGDFVSGRKVELVSQNQTVEESLKLWDSKLEWQDMFLADAAEFNVGFWRQDGTTWAVFWVNDKDLIEITLPDDRRGG